MAFPVFFDTCAIYGAGVNDLLLTLAERGLYRRDIQPASFPSGCPGRVWPGSRP